MKAARSSNTIRYATPLLIFISITSNSQIQIGTNSKVTINGAVSLNTTINNATNADLTNAQINLAGNNQEIKTNQSLKVAALKVNAGGTKSVSGNWEVTEVIQLVNGVLKVEDNAQLLFTGADVVEGSNASYIEGFFRVSGTGRKNFPVGVNGLYLPVQIEGLSDASVPLGVQAVGASANFLLPEESSSLLPSHYWQFTSAPNVPVALSLAGSGDFLNGQPPLMLEAEATGVQSFSVPSIATGDFITSTEQVTKPFVTIGKKPEFSLVIHDMITPYNLDEVNDKLFIEKIELTYTNKVKLLDRWGAVAAQWDDFNNDTSYDFSKLSPGNYVCIVEYFMPGENNKSVVQGIVSILNSK